MELPRADRCETCKFWDSLKDEADPAGSCMRYPPVLLTVGQHHSADGWSTPATPPTHWCGEWKSKEPAVSEVTTAEGEPAKTSRPKRKAAKG